MRPSARARGFMASHDVVGAAVRLAATSAVAALLLAGVVVLAPAATFSAGLVAMTAAMAKGFGVTAGAAVLLWVVATLERGVAAEELVDEITAYLDAAPPAHG